MYVFPTKKNTIVLLVFIIPMLVAGVWTVFEAFYLNKLIQNHKFAHRHSEIDDIKGDVGEWGLDESSVGSLQSSVSVFRLE